MKKELKPYNVKAILKSVKAVLKNNDSSKLTKEAYNFVNLMFGFIAHYNINGFRNHYVDLRDFVNELELSIPVEIDICQRDVNDKPNYNGYGLPYCQSKLAIVLGIAELVKKYKNSIIKAEAEKDINKFELLKELIKRAETDEEIKLKLLDAIF